jgi:hypothetical protein
MLKRLKGAAVGCAVLAIMSTAVLAAGNWGDYPQVGQPSFCFSTVSGAGGFNAQGNTNNVNPTGQGQATSGSLCAQTVPAGPPILTGLEIFPLDTGGAGGVYPGTTQPQTATIPSTLLANGYGGTTVATTTGTTAAVQALDGISNYIYAGAGAATYTSFKLPPNPINNQTFCLSDAGSGILSLTAVAAGVNNFGNTPTITGTTPTSIPVMTAVGTAGTVTLGKNCWLFQAAAGNTGVWYRTL